MRRLVTLLVALGFLAGLGGCRNKDLVEAELRTQERRVYELRDELERSECYNQSLQRELRGLRQQSCSIISPELASQTYTLKNIVLGRGTGGYDEDHCPGDEALQVIVEPKDPDGHAIKAPGSLHVIALEISPEGLKTPFSSWDIPPEQLRRHWRSGLFSTGYQLILPWKQLPTSPKIRVVAQFTVADGRVFETDKDLTIKLPLRPPGPILPVVPEESLPPPRPVEPEKPKEPLPPLDLKDPGQLLGLPTSRTAQQSLPPLYRAAKMLPPVAIPGN